MKSINHWQEKLKKTSADGKIFYAHGSIETTLRKWPYYQKQSTCSTQSHEISNGIFCRHRKINIEICMETQKALTIQRHSEQKVH
jgi:hypothetical protein